MVGADAVAAALKSMVGAPEEQPKPPPPLPDIPLAGQRHELSVTDLCVGAVAALIGSGVAKGIVGGTRGGALIPIACCGIAYIFFRYALPQSKRPVASAIGIQSGHALCTIS